MLHLIFKILFIFVSLFLIGIILIQRARGGGLAGAFGGAGSDSPLSGFQSRELVRLTTWLAAGFIFLAILMDFMPPERKGIEIDQLPAPPPTSAPLGTQPGPGAAPADQDLAPIEEGAGPGE